MRYLLLTAVLLTAVTLPKAQVQLLSTSSRTARAMIDMAAGQLSKSTDEGEPSHFQSLELSVSNGELVIQFELAEHTDKGYYEMKGMEVLIDGQPLLLEPEQIIGETGKIPTGGRKKLVLAQLLERNVTLKGSLMVTMTIASYGERKLPFGIDCSAPPTFTAKQRLPYYLAAGAGAACIGLGQYYRIQSQDVYENDYKNAATLQEATPYYEDANGKHHTYLILTYGGSALLVADAVLYFIRDRNYRKKTELYKEYCGGTSFLLEPIIETPSLRNPDGQAGIRFTLNF
jgi:hypothetical protein